MISDHSCKWVSIFVLIVVLNEGSIVPVTVLGTVAVDGIGWEQLVPLCQFRSYDIAILSKASVS